jgi:23S rRNA A2030 N6-methylase RlmJ
VSAGAAPFTDGGQLRSVKAIYKRVQSGQLGMWYPMLQVEQQALYRALLERGHYSGLRTFYQQHGPKKTLELLDVVCVKLYGAKP